MKSYSCLNCGEQHEFSTLLEFPQPEIISNISSGKLNKRLKVIGKDFYSIDKSIIICQAEMEIPILDLDDIFEMLVWVQIEIKLLKPIMAKGKEEGLLQVPGKLLHPIPFYDGANNLEAVISIDFKEDENATVIGILNHEKLNQDIKNGLKIEELIFLFARLCKLIKSI